MRGGFWWVGEGWYLVAHCVSAGNEGFGDGIVGVEVFE